MVRHAMLVAMMQEKYGSRKFLVTMAAIASTTLLAGAGVMTNGVGVVFAAAIASYNWANAKQKTDAPRE